MSAVITTKAQTFCQGDTNLLISYLESLEIDVYSQNRNKLFLCHRREIRVLVALSELK